MNLSEKARSLVDSLARHQQKIVLAESCTGGMVSAELAKVSGVSQWHCGSAVTYRNETKMRWLGVDEQTLAQHTAVSLPVAEQMAAGVLAKTPEADIAAAITGHFGPQAPDGFDGVTFIGLAWRQGKAISVRAEQFSLRTASRLQRQAEAVGAVLDAIERLLDAA